MKVKQLFLIIIFFNILRAENTEMSISATNHSKMPLAIIMLNKTDNELNSLAHIIKNDFDFTDQFITTIHPHNARINKKDFNQLLHNFCTNGIPLLLCINTQSKKVIEWRLYDTLQESMITGKKYKKKEKIERVGAHAIADDVYKQLTGNNGFFSSRVAYCKETKNKQKNTIRHIYIADFDGKNEELLVDVPTITVAPRWHTQKPVLFYSEYTNTNVRLMSITMNKKKEIASNFDGINILPCVSHKGNAVAYCASHGKGNCQVYLYKKGVLERFTDNNGNNESPIFIDDKHISFASDFETGSPQIYIGDIHNGKVQRITDGGYCSSPSYCPINNTLSYHKMINGKMHIITYNLTTKQKKRITKDNANYHESSWSPDGTHVVCRREHNGDSQIVSLNLLTDKLHYLTDKKDQCSYPHWSPNYKIFPVVT